MLEKLAQFVKSFLMFFFPILSHQRASRKAARQLFQIVMQRSREPVFFAELDVPDTFSGRFEMIALHNGLLINRVRGEGKAGHYLAQALFDEMFLNMEIACRQAGIGDLGVPKQIKKMMKALQGRAMVYEEAAEVGTLQDALAKNLYATVERPSDQVLTMMSDYIIACRKDFDVQNLADMLNGQLSFTHLPAGDHDAQISKIA